MQNRNEGNWLGLSLNTAEFIDAVNKLRLSAKNKWYMSEYNVNGKQVRIKGYNTWLQIFRVEGARQNTLMDISVMEFKNTLKQGVGQ